VRRLLIESAWHHRKSYSTSGPTLRARWAKVDPALRARGHAGNRRLNKRWRSFTERVPTGRDAQIGTLTASVTRVAAPTAT
jgi:hypothetical protein